MTVQMKNDFIKAFCNFLEVTIPVDDPQPKQENINDNVELLTIKECTQEISGLSEHAVRQLVARNEIPYIRVGESKRGKILIDKRDLIHFLKKQHYK